EVLWRLARSVREQFPIFQEPTIRVAEHRGGLPTLTMDDRYLVGPLPGVAGAWVMSGCCVGGLSVSPALGEAIAEWIVDGAPALDCSDISPARFALPIERAVALMGAMSADQRAEVFRDLPQRTAARLLAAVDTSTQESLRSLLNYPPTTAGGIMTTEHVEAPATWTVERTLVQIRSGGHPRRPVYAVYVLDPVDRRLVHTVTLRELVLADPTRTLLEVGDRHPPVTVRAWTDREETARLIAK